MLEHLRNLLHASRAERDERGASAVEYGLLVAGIAALIVAVVFVFGGMISNVFQRLLQPDQRPAMATTTNTADSHRIRTHHPVFGRGPHPAVDHGRNTFGPREDRHGPARRARCVRG